MSADSQLMEIFVIASFDRLAAFAYALLLVALLGFGLVALSISLVEPVLRALGVR